MGACFQLSPITVPLFLLLEMTGMRWTKTASSFYDVQLSTKTSVAWVIKSPEGKVNTSQGVERRNSDASCKHLYGQFVLKLLLFT